MNYVRSITGSVSKGWNSINPATLSGAIDAIVVEREDGSLANTRSCGRRTRRWNSASMASCRTTP
jgi:phosphatidate phosphatase PAH1